MGQGFAQGIADFGSESIEAVKRIQQQSFADVMVDASIPLDQGGRMPVRTGELRDSVVITTVNGTTRGADNIRTAVNNAPAGTKLEGGWEAPSAVPVEFGSDGDRPRAFARGAVAKWGSFVEQNARKEAENG